MLKVNFNFRKPYLGVRNCVCIRAWMGVCESICVGLYGHPPSAQLQSLPLSDKDIYYKYSQALVVSADFKAVLNISIWRK